MHTTIPDLLAGIHLSPNFDTDHYALFKTLIDTISWDETIKSRKTASFGVPYNYSNMTYEVQPIPEVLAPVLSAVNAKIGYVSNNCLINYYHENESAMGFHEDNVEYLAAGTGVCILSLGNDRILRFRNTRNKDLKHDIELKAGSLFYMSQEIQQYWQHAILRTQSNGERISLTFRSITTSK